MKESALLKVRDLIHRERRPSFLNQIDLYSIEEGIVIGASGIMGIGLRLEGRDLLLMSEAEIADFEARGRKFLNSLEPGTILHFIVRAQSGDEGILEEYRNSIHVKDKFSGKLVQSRIDSFAKNPFFKKEIFLFVILDPEWERKENSFLPDLGLFNWKRHRPIREEEYKKAKEKLIRNTQLIQQGLGDLGFSAERLTEDEILEYLYEILNPGYSKLLPFGKGCLRRFTDESLRSRLLVAPPRAEYDSIYLDGFYHQTLNLRALPEETDLKVFKDFEQGLGKDFLFSLRIEVPDQEKEKRSVKRHGNFSKAQAFFSRTKQHEALERAGESDDLLTELAASGDKLFSMQMAVTLKDKNPHELERKAEEIIRVFPRLGDARGLIDHMNHDRLFLSCLPLQGGENPLDYRVRSEVLLHLLPLQASWPGTDHPGLLLKTYRDEPLKLDIFDPRLQAKHALMLGTTGSGKSFFTNHLILQFLIQSIGNEVIVIDVGGSYRKLAEVYGGSYLEVECDEEFALNPFPTKDTLFPNEKDADSTFIQFLKEILQKMIDPKRDFSSSEKVILERAIREVYSKISLFDAPLLGDITKVLRDFPFGDDEDKRKAYQFSKELVLFTEGEYGKILNRKGKFDIDSRFTVFDLRKISQYPELQEILLLVIPFALKRKFEDIDRKKLLVLDECWRLLKENEGRELVEVFYRTARKFNAGVLSISQSPEDFLEAQVSGSIINNSSVKYILRLHKGHEKLAQLGFNENEIRAVSELEVRPGYFSETFIKFDTESVLARLEPSPLDYWIATTDPEDLSEELRLKWENEGKGFKRSVFDIIAEMSRAYPHGVRKREESGHAA